MGVGQGCYCGDCSLCLPSLSTLVILLQEALSNPPASVSRVPGLQVQPYLATWPISKRSSAQHLWKPPRPCPPHVPSSNPALTGTQHRIAYSQLSSDPGLSEEHGLGESVRITARSPQRLADVWQLFLPSPSSSSHLLG